VGNSFTNLQIRAGGREPVVAALRFAGALPAYVSTGGGGWISAYPQCTEAQDAELLQRIAGAVSRRLGAPVIAFLVHDSDNFCYWLFDNGWKHDAYESRPGFFEGRDAPPEGGDAAMLMRYCGPGATREKIDAVLGEPPPHAEDQAGSLAELLGIRRERAEAGWKYVGQGDLRAGEVEKVE